ncbi:lytic transglycosylase domain-containing protein [Sphingomonas cannabina]|uniref:lytic transglycosylase domain-containing protein n=1 Tax=Sphingomonas cannabina TaxID=2899123 RepID=UPI001F40DA01|nr:lytic transglycosylase domain-containing protein [Sphingomonas cannabina]UIJ46259.1 lytic transglycosylase domain-containing protein [Sphingomonas cannabina]
MPSALAALLLAALGAPDAPHAGPQPVASLVDPVMRWRSYMREASQRFGIPLEWIERVMRAESGGRTHLDGRPITSHAGAMGLMQIMPATWTELRAELGLGDDPHDPRDNILAGTCYLRRMYDRFGYPGLFGAYNAGPARYAAWLAGARRLPAETRAYLAEVGGGSTSSPTVEAHADQATLFAIQASVPPSVAPTSRPSRSRLFAVLSREAAPVLDRD